MSSEHVMDTVALAQRARSALGNALEALQSDSAHGQLFGVAEPLARALGICAQIANDARAGADLALALASIRRALELLQQPELQHHSALLQRATAGVAQALAALHELERLRGNEPTLAGTRHEPAASASDELCVEAALGAHSETNFYRGLSASDVVQGGGLFVETYVLPALGQRLTLKLSMPGGYETQVRGVVVWSREPGPGSVAPGAPPGFGARLIEVSLEARQLIQRYVNNREPLIVDDP
jgi:hypothetical protein